MSQIGEDTCDKLLEELSGLPQGGTASASQNPPPTSPARGSGSASSSSAGAGASTSRRGDGGMIPPFLNVAIHDAVKDILSSS